MARSLANDVVEEKLRDLIAATVGSSKQSHLPPSLSQKYKRDVQKKSLDRVNQFAVDERLQGLEERWRILLEDDSADALSSQLFALKRLEIEHQYQFLPECLQLLLSLSAGRPAADFQQSLKNAKKNREGSDFVAQSAAFADADHEDPFIWENIDYGIPDSDTGSEDLPELPTNLQAVQTIQEADPVDSKAGRLSDDEKLFTVEHSAAYAEIERIQETRRSLQDLAPEGRTATERTLVKETILMLSGLQTDLYMVNELGQVQIKTKISLTDVTPQALNSLLWSFASLGDKVNDARQAVGRNEASPVVKRYQEAIRKHLLGFYSFLATIESQLTDDDAQRRSLIRLLIEGTRKFSAVEALVQIAPSTQGENTTDRDSRLFTNLLDTLSEVELIEGNLEGVTAVALKDCLNDCFVAYWRPIRSWITGNNTNCDRVSFIKPQTGSQVALNHFWQQAYLLDRERAPPFLQPYVRTILMAGKTSAFLSRINGSSPGLESKSRAEGDLLEDLITAPRFAFDNVWQRMDAELRKRCIEKVQGVNDRLLNALSRDWHLWETIQSLQLVYLAETGSVNDRANAAFFRLLDLSMDWDDRFLLTDIFQRAFEDVLPTSVSLITVSVDFDDRTKNARERSLVKLEAVKIKYAMPWPLSNLISADSLSTLQNVGTLLLQISRAKHCLDQHVRDRLHTTTSAGLGALRVGLEHRLRWFLNLVHSYIALDVLPIASKIWREELPESRDLDAMIDIVRKSIAKLEHGCLIAEALRPTHQALISLLDLATVLTESPRWPESTGATSSGALNYPTASKAGTPRKAQHDADRAKLIELNNTYRQLLSFVHSGIKEAARATSDPKMELFADDLALELTSLNGRKAQK